MLFNAIYRPARQGRKVAYLTLASAGFLLLVLAVTRLVPNEHPTRKMSADKFPHAPQLSETVELEGVSR
ncbi:hypothetical protein amad1_02885 [Alteromonas mediterranea DE1]|nr:hypothetical protein amad1_02885 [Alteromonas mediterranea DE1]